MNSGELLVEDAECAEFVEIELTEEDFEKEIELLEITKRVILPLQCLIAATPLQRGYEEVLLAIKGVKNYYRPAF